ncbi:hypothetical protein ABZ192_42435, partial [Streptomyces sp. NPDC006235]|uniref:hypothetical protein n=1 Tax=Streptomyces sp. NPDC006235 TaxID=3156736 RepID=UPI00339FE3D3
GLLNALRKAGAHEQVTVLAGRAAAHTPLDDASAVDGLLGMLQEAGADKQVTVLAERFALAGGFALFINHAGHREQFQFGREPDGSAAPPWTWNDLD